MTFGVAKEVFILVSFDLVAILSWGSVPCAITLLCSYPRDCVSLGPSTFYSHSSTLLLQGFPSSP